MLAYLVRRLLYAIPILLGVSIVTFVIFYMSVSPRQMARRNLSTKNPTEVQIQAWLTARGYNRPPAEQLKKHINELFRFQFGTSDTSKERISDRLRRGVGPSALVAGTAFVFALFTQLVLALFVAYYRGTYVDTYGVFICVLLMSVVYMVYIIAGQFLLGKLWRLFPLGGYRDGAASLRFVVLPALIGTASGVGAGVRLYRTFLLDEVGQDYVRTARAKGVPEKLVMFRHVLKNAAIPILTTVVLAVPFLLTGSLLLESFFGIPGLGSMTVDAISNQDFSTVRAMVFLGAILYIIGSIATDLSYALADPRVRFE